MINMIECLNCIRNCLINNKKGFVIKYNNNNINGVKIFLKINILKFIKIKNKKIIVYMNIINNKYVFNNIINLYKPKKKIFFSLKNLKKCFFKKKYFFIISTNKGVFNSFDAIKYNVGGIAVAQI